MAAELAGGALLSAFLQVAFDKLASPQLLDFFRRRKLHEKLLGNLNIMLHSINALADDAELRQFTDPNVKAWLLAVKEAVFDAEDLLGEIDYELTKCQVEAQYEPQTFTYKVSNFFNSTFTSFNKKIESGMKEVLEKLEYLAKQKDALGLKECTYSGDGSSSKMSQKLPSSSLVVESVIYGRDADKDIIINWLTSQIDNPKQPSILSIVGMGGLGKTTLAQHVYNDPKIDDAKFDIKAWVCVSDHFHVLTVTRTVLEAITNKKDDSGNLEMVHKKIKENLSKRKFLLVLDDVWNERPAEWEAVRTPLSYGAPGSRILVTTRGEKVASNMRSKVHRLKQLGEDEGWNVFENHSSKDGDHEFNDELKEIGRRIVEKCKGLPLALKSIGCLLRTKSSISDWKSIMESEIWELPKEDSEIIPALFVSYRYLPSHLKKCFAYCALFPKDHKFVKEELILLWMAQNFLQCPQQKRRPEEVGEQYFNDLLSRSFFQQSGKRHFLMHDLLNDLAKYVCADFCFRLKFDKGLCIPNTTRHFSFDFDDVKSFDGFGSLTDAKRLRSFLPISESWGNEWHFKISIHDLLSKIMFIRMLSFCGCSYLEEVPNSVGDLKHLHSLDLSSTGIQKLPDSICLLYNLLILKLNSCSKLEELPLNLHKLTKLRCLEFERTKVRKMPMHFGELKNLQVLSTFFLDRNSELSTKQLGGLGGLNLHGRLSINDVQNILNPLHALEANVKNKHLVELELQWKSDHIPDDPRKEKEVLQNLQPSNHLEILSIRNYSGTEFPSWLFDNSLSNLVFLQLEDCKYCLCLPPLGIVSSLKTLEIRGFDGIVSIGAEFYGSNSSFACLESLTFDNMKEWEEWECKTTSFPRLQELYVNECPKLKGTRLKMKVVVSDELIISENSMDTSPLETLHIDGGCDSLTIFRLDFFPMIWSLNLRKCQNLRRISQEYAHNHLMYLCVYDCPQFKSFLFPKPMQILFPSITILKITVCPQVELFPYGSLPLNVKHISLSCLKLITSLRETLDPNACLESLSIENLEVELFPDEVLLPRSLTSLKIRCCPNLKKMHYNGLCHLSYLMLSECPSLQCLPAEGLPKSISSLTISNCPLLKERCRKPDGEDWKKIAHIQKLTVWADYESELQN
uniref:CNL-B16 n=1 Tax=Phaseolus vulgaris TaxID=3885 RepID=B8R505_PHAVU|nr:NBS-LRR type putative disease resistance protein CNL-B16 [Phaseolus vulgaris]ACZ74712.1 CNL-B16 [Phaseolus vulgaris]